MRDGQAVRRPPVRTSFALILLLGPFLLGMFGLATWFIPNPRFKGAAALVGVAYYAILWACRSHLRSVEVQLTAWDQAKLVLAVPLFCYFSYVAFYVTIPAVFTDIFGSPAHRQYVIAEIQQSSRKAWLCPYRVKLSGVRTVFSDSLCAGASFVTAISPGESVNFDGKESSLGFRITGNAR